MKTNHHLYSERLDFVPDVKSFVIADPDHRFHHLSKHGFAFNYPFGRWETRLIPQAHAYAQHLEVSNAAQKVLDRYYIAERPVEPDRFDWPAFELPIDFQLRAASFALSRNRSYLALDPGLGKTVVSALIHNADPGRSLVVCPSFLKLNWEREIKRWDTTGLREFDVIAIERAEDAKYIDASVPFVILPDSFVGNETVRKQLAANKFKRLYIDEAHRFKSMNSKRTLGIFGGFQKTAKGEKYKRGLEAAAENVVSLSGTPMPNRPFELWPVLYSQALGEIEFMRSHDFGVKYCGGVNNGYGFEYRGSSNADELRERVFSKYMLRIKKEDVLADLPEKRREMILLDKSLPAHVSRAFDRGSIEGSVSGIIERARAEYRTKRGRMNADEWLDSDARLKALGEFAVIRREVGLRKVKPATEIIRERLDTTDEKLVVFAHHRTVIGELEKNLARFKPLIIHGGVAPDERFKLAHRFQDEDRSRLIILNTAAGGVGFNLQAASRLLFVEFDWVPEVNRQCEDRIHRIGSEHDSVLCEYLVAADSFDEVVLNSVFRKMKTIDKTINKGV